MTDLPIWIDKDGSKWEEHADGRLSYNGGLPKTVAEVAITWGPLTPPDRTKSKVHYVEVRLTPDQYNYVRSAVHAFIPLLRVDPEHVSHSVASIFEVEAK